MVQLDGKGDFPQMFYKKMCIAALMKSLSLDEINHKFLVPGHTHMEYDTSYTLIMKNKNHFNGNIHHPHDSAPINPTHR